MVENISADVTTPEFASRLGSYLREVRRERSVRLRHMVDDALPIGVLRKIEKGVYPLEPMLVAELAGRYGADLHEILPTRDPVVILATGTIAAGGMDEQFEPGDVDSVLRAYLDLILRLRGADSDYAVTLRRDDLIDVADQLGRPRAEIVDRLAVLLGATGAQRRAMVDLYLSGAIVVGITG